VGNFEVYRHYVNNSLDYERTTNKLSDDTKTFALVETRTGENPVMRYQYDNHLGSACLELDANANIISYEEYHPFGTTSYRAGRSYSEVSLKRYKYCGKERDEETGLYYYGARYYAGWLCRFVSVDPMKEKYPELSTYQYASNRPITGIDLDGLEFYSIHSSVFNTYGIPYDKDNRSGLTNKTIEQFSKLGGNKPSKLNCFQACLYIWATADPEVTDYLIDLDKKVSSYMSGTGNMSSPNIMYNEFKNNADKNHYFIDSNNYDIAKFGDMAVFNNIKGIDAIGHYAIVLEKAQLLVNNSNIYMQLKVATTYGNPDQSFGEATYFLKLDDNGKWMYNQSLYLDGFLRIDEFNVKNEKLEKMPLLDINKIENNTTNNVNMLLRDINVNNTQESKKWNNRKKNN
jgi:RHS repeat-associated protein